MFDGDVKMDGWMNETTSEWMAGVSFLTWPETGCDGGWGGGPCGALNSYDSCFGLVLFL